MIEPRSVFFDSLGSKKTDLVICLVPSSCTKWEAYEGIYLYLYGQQPFKHLWLDIADREDLIDFLFGFSGILAFFSVQDCVSCHKSIAYIGHTTTSLSRRFMCHLSDQCAIKNHLSTDNLQEPLRKIMVKNTTILYISYYQKHFAIREALYYVSPTINFTVEMEC